MSGTADDLCQWGDLQYSYISETPCGKHYKLVSKSTIRKLSWAQSQVERRDNIVSLVMIYHMKGIILGIYKKKMKKYVQLICHP